MSIFSEVLSGQQAQAQEPRNQEDQRMKMQQFLASQKQAQQEAQMKNYAFTQQQTQDKLAQQQRTQQAAGAADYLNLIRNRAGGGTDSSGPGARLTGSTSMPEMSPLSFDTVSASLLKQKPDMSPEEFNSAMKQFEPQFQQQDKMRLAQFQAQARAASRGPGTVEEQIYGRALASGKSEEEAKNAALDYKRSQGIAGAQLTGKGDVQMRTGGVGSIEAAAQAKAAGTESGKNKADLPEIARGTKDVVNTYKLLKKDSEKAPSGALESGAATAANILGMPTKGSIAQASFEANANNLFLATIRTLKGTGRVMQSEIENIKQAAPKPADSTEVKNAKIEAHMNYYNDRMKDLGFDPDTGQPLDKKEPQEGGGTLKTIDFNSWQ